MKTRKWPLVCMAILTVLCMSACQDWGETDPPAGNQIFPSLERVANLTFDEELLPEEIQTFAYNEGTVPSLETDEEHGQVLHLADGYARIFNPLNQVKVQNGVSLTMWVKQAAPAEGEEQDLTGALFSFQNETGSQRMFFTANGWLSYQGEEGTYEDNNPQEIKTELMTAGEWHYLAIAVTNSGYFVYIDGEQKIEKSITAFDFSNMVKMMASVPYMYIGYGSETQTGEMWVDDVKIYRNTITQTQTNKPEVGGETSTVITVGATDFSTGWWSEFSKILTAEGDCIFHYKFKNYNNGASSMNWNNWVLGVSNGKAPGDEGYKEYAVIRADNWGWLDGMNDDNHRPVLESNYDWDTFVADMNGAVVDLTIKRIGSELKMTAVITTTEAKTLNYSWTRSDMPSGTIGTFLTVDGAYLEISPEETSVGKAYEKGSHIVGQKDCTTGWWTAFSTGLKQSGNCILNFQFYNHSSGKENWHNYALVVTDGTIIGDPGYGLESEYVILRSDAFGWGPYYKADNFTHSFIFPEPFRTQMQGALVDMKIKRNGNLLTITAVITTTEGKELEYSYYCEEIPASTPLGAFLTIEGGYLDILSASTYPFINSNQ